MQRRATLTMIVNEDGSGRNELAGQLTPMEVLWFLERAKTELLAKYSKASELDELLRPRRVT